MNLNICALVSETGNGIAIAKAASALYRGNEKHYKERFMIESATPEFHQLSRQQRFDDLIKQLKNISVSPTYINEFINFTHYNGLDAYLERTPR